MQPKRHPPSPHDSPPAGDTPHAQPGDPSQRLVAPDATHSPGRLTAPDANTPFADTAPDVSGQPVVVGGAADEAAFTAIVARNRQDLYAFLRGLLGADELAQDLTQDTFHDAWRAALRGAPPFASLLPTPASAHDADNAIRRWLFHAAYYKALSARRRWRLIRWESLDLSADSAASLADHTAGAFDQRVVEGDALRAALARLTPQDAACLLLRVVQGFSAAEVGAITGASAEIVTKRLSRARQRLREVYLALNAPDTAPHHDARQSDRLNAQRDAPHDAPRDAHDDPPHNAHDDGSAHEPRPDVAPKEQAHP